MTGDRIREYRGEYAEKFLLRVHHRAVSSGANSGSSEPGCPGSLLLATRLRRRQGEEESEHRKLVMFCNQQEMSSTRDGTEPGLCVGPAGPYVP